MRPLTKITPAVFYTQGELSALSREEVDWLTHYAQSNGLPAVRICLHPTLEDPHHDMIIAQSKESFVHPHKHPSKSETYHVLEGSARYVFFNEHGEIISTGILDKEHPILRVPADHFHTTIPLSEWFVFHEAARGPFLTGGMVKAKWLTTKAELASTLEKFLAKK